MKVEVLGNVQDGGVPHLGCNCDICEKARKDKDYQKYVSSLILKENDDKDSIRYLIDPTADIRFQIVGDYIDGIFASHGHLGHITGLLYFGRESLDATKLPVYCTEKTKDFIMKNDPYRLLIDRNNIEINEIEDGSEEEIQGGVIEARQVPHRHLSTDALSFMIEGEEKKLYYLSDIDEWTDKAVESVKEADIAIIDGTFWSRDEIDRYEDVPHPPIKETMEKMRDFDTDIYFTHLNHTNPALRENSDERKQMEEQGFGIVEQGQVFEI